MDKIVRDGFDSAEKELKEKQIAEVKKIVLKTLEKIEGKTKERDKLSEEIRLLKMDIDDLKEGKIERIVERQEKDPKAKEVAVVIIIKEKEVGELSPWYWPYQIIWQYPVYSTPGLTFTGGTFGSYATSNATIGLAEGATITGTSGGGSITLTSDNCCITNSTAKDGVVGSYTIENKVIHLR